MLFYGGSMEEAKRQKKGIIYTLIGAALWGLSGTCGQYLFQYQTVSPEWLTVVRLFIAGGILTAITAVKAPQNYVAIFKNKQHLTKLLLFAIFGILVCQYTYLVTISYTNSGTATVLQYLGPIFILIFMCLKNRKLPTKIEALAISCAVLGTFLIATHGDPTSLVLSKQGLIWGILSALALMTYTLLPRDLLPIYGSATVMALGMLISGIILFPLVRFWELEVVVDMGGVLAIVGVTFLGTLISFYLYMEGIKLIGPVKASMVASAEPVSATIISFLWLGTAFGIMDIVGFAFIICTVFLLAKN